MKVLFDSSALIAFILKEQSWQQIRDYLADACMTSVNFMEVMTVLPFRYEMPEARVHGLLAQSDMEIIPVDKALAMQAAKLTPLAQRYGLSLGDKICIACAMQQHLSVITTDERWTRCEIGVEVKYIR